MTVDRRSLLALTAASSLKGSQAAAGVASSPAKSVNVRDYGAQGDGVTDDTAAFNRATRAAVPWSTDLEMAILVPAGNYKISGTVFLRKGQSLVGEGQSSQIDARDARNSTFIMGSSSGVGRRGQDPGGSPVRIENLRTLGGSPKHGLIFTNVAGFSLHGLFMTACGIGIEIEGNDGTLSDIYIDQCLNGIVLRGAQSIVISNSIWYSANFGMSIGSDVRALSVSNCVFSFTRYAAINLEEGARSIKASIFDSCVFISNEQYATFLGYVHCRASAVELHFNACIFRNWPRYAINHAAGEVVSLRFSACAFDASRASDDHNQTSTAAGISTGMAGDYRFSMCEFKWLMSPVAMIGAGLKRLAFEGGAIEEMATPRFQTSGIAVPGSVIVRNVDGVGRISQTPRGPVVLVPAMDGVDWRLCLSGYFTQRRGRSAFLQECIISSAAGGTIVNLQNTSEMSAKAALAIERNSGSKSDELRIRFDASPQGGELLRASLDTL